MSSTPPETYPDIPRPGDADFVNFPKHLPDDCIEYTVHILTTPSPSPSALRSRLLQFQRAATDLCKSLLKNYIWQREAFSLALVNGNENPGNDTTPGPEHTPTENDNRELQWCLKGSTSFGDSIADEWLIVYVLRQLSKKFNDAWIRVVDADGEFLLIEAANTLPKWLNPEVAEHRVWINKGDLRLIPKEETMNQTSATNSVSSAGKKKPTKPQPSELSLRYALDFIRKEPESLIHSPIIEAEAFYRIRKYPTAISESLHTALITIPRNLAYILRRNPAYISPAVEAFYLRDPIALKPLQIKPAKDLRFSPEDLITVSVRFTRVGFAQMRSQEFSAPPAWVAPLAKAFTTFERIRMEMGMKVACGFEMLVGDPQNRDARAVREIGVLMEDLEEGEEVLPDDEEIMAWERKEDDEKWLDVNFEDFERELDGRSNGKKKDGKAEKDTGGSFGDASAQENLRRMVEQFEAFLNDGDAGEEGADFGDEMDYDDDEDDEDDPEEDREASFDQKEFAEMMKQMMGMQDEGDALTRHAAARGKRMAELEEREGKSDEDSDEEDEMEVGKGVSASNSKLRKAKSKDADRRPLWMDPDPNSSDEDILHPKPATKRPARNARIEDLLDSEDDDDEEDEDDMQIVMQRMETELKQAGALGLDTPGGGSETSRVLKDSGSKCKKADSYVEPDDPRFIMAKNLLESFKAQGSASGPMGNLLASFGQRFPRDEREEEEEEEDEAQEGRHD